MRLECFCGSILRLAMIRKLSSILFAGLLLFLGASCSSSGGGAAGVIDKDKHGMPQYHDHVKVRVVRTTAYHCNECDHKIYGAKSAAGVPLRYGKIRSAAADWSRYPLGTKFKIEGLPFTYVVDDYGSALVGTNTIDLYKLSSKEMRWWGVRKVEIKIIEMGDFDLSEKILSTRRRHAHCRKMHSELQRKLAGDGGRVRNAG